MGGWMSGWMGWVDEVMDVWVSGCVDGLVGRVG